MKMRISIDVETSAECDEEMFDIIISSSNIGEGVTPKHIARGIIATALQERINVTDMDSVAVHYVSRFFGDSHVGE